MVEKKEKEKKTEKKKATKKIEEKKIKELEKTIEEKDNEIKELNDKYLRLYAETENMRKRLEREKKDFLEYANESVLKDLLPIIDNMERAIEHSEQNSNIEDFIKGIELTLNSFLKVLEKYGVKPVDALHKPFDPNFHEAMQVQETDEFEPNTVVQQLQKGYTFKERLLRPALVIVSKKPVEQSEKTDNNIDN